MQKNRFFKLSMRTLCMSNNNWNSLAPTDSSLMKLKTKSISWSHLMTLKKTTNSILSPNLIETTLILIETSENLSIHLDSVTETKNPDQISTGFSQITETDQLGSDSTYSQDKEKTSDIQFSITWKNFFSMSNPSS